LASWSLTKSTDQSFIRSAWYGHRNAGPGDLLAPLRPNLQAKSGIDAIGSLTINHQRFGTHQVMQHQIAVARILLRECFEPDFNGGIVTP